MCNFFILSTVLTWVILGFLYRKEIKETLVKIKNFITRSKEKIEQVKDVLDGDGK